MKHNHLFDELVSLYSLCHHIDVCRHIDVYIRSLSVVILMFKWPLVGSNIDGFFMGNWMVSQLYKYMEF